MVDAEAIKERGRAMGLNPPRERVAISPHGKKWQPMKAGRVEVGMMVKGKGRVNEVNDVQDGGHVQLHLGDLPNPVIVAKTTVLDVFA